MAVFHHFVDLPPAGSSEAVRDARVHNGPTFDEHSGRFELTVNLVEKRFVRVSRHQGVAESADGRAVGYVILKANACKPAERKAVIHLVFNLSVAQSIPYTQKLDAKEHEAIIGGASVLFAFRLQTGRIKNTADGFPINQSVDLIKELGTYLAAACAIISKAVGGSPDFHGIKILRIPHMSNSSAYFCRGLKTL